MQYPYGPSEYLVEGGEYYPPRYPALGYYDRERLGEDYVEPGVYSGLPRPAYYESNARRPYYPQRPDYGYRRGDEYAGYDSRRSPPVYVRPGVPLRPVVYDDDAFPSSQNSDLGLGARDSHIVTSTDYRAGYGTPDFTAPYVATGAYVDGAAEATIERLEDQLERERRHEHEGEVVAAGATGYGLYERHENHRAGQDVPDGYYSHGYAEGRNRRSNYRPHRLRNILGID